MARWVCPACDRHFGNQNQSHTCVPGNDLELTFAGYPVSHREICDEIIECLEQMGPLHVDPVTVGVFLKGERKLGELRPKQRWVSLALVLPDRVEHHRIRRHERVSAGRAATSCGSMRSGTLTTRCAAGWRWRTTRRPTDPAAWRTADCLQPAALSRWHRALTTRPDTR